MLISTLKEIFLGNKELFKNLWIGQDNRYDWEKRPVIHIDFSKLNTETLDTLKNDLNNTLDTIATHYDINASHRPFPQEKITYLVEALGAHTKVAILVDEYDSPMLKHIGAPKTAKNIMDFLAGFYATIKALDAYIHFTFVTGVTKFSKTSLFSGANNLDDISLKEKFATLCGYTEEEIINNLSDYITEFATTRNVTSNNIVQEMRAWYNGYQMSDYLIEKVYNPYSVLLYLENKKCKNYWFTTGTPTFLIKLLKKHFNTFATLDHSTADTDTFDSFEIGKLPLKTILYQSGYLTIENYDEKKRIYRLTYPNEEVRQSVSQTLLKSVLKLENESTQDTINALHDALDTKNIAGFCTTLQIIFAHIPYQLHIKQEAFYHALLQMICYMLGTDVTSEISVSGGITDMVIQTTETIFVFEFKLNKAVKETASRRAAKASTIMLIGKKAEKALKQIHDRRYYEKYLLTKKDIYLVGLSFNYSTKTISHVAEKLEGRL